MDYQFYLSFYFLPIRGSQQQQEKDGTGSMEISTHGPQYSINVNVTYKLCIPVLIVTEFCPESFQSWIVPYSSPFVAILGKGLKRRKKKQSQHIAAYKRMRAVQEKKCTPNY